MGPIDQFRFLRRKVGGMKMSFSIQTIKWVSVLILLACLNSTTSGFSSTPPPVGSLSFSVANGDCLPATSSVSAGRVAVTITLTSSQPQTVSLVTTSADVRHLFQHTQVGTSEAWSTVLDLPAGSYELINSIGTSKCAVTVS